MPPLQDTTDSPKRQDGQTMPSLGWPLASLRLEGGTCHAMFAYDIGFSVDLDEVQRRLSAVTQRKSISRNRRLPSYFDFDPPPVHVAQMGEPVGVAGLETENTISALIFDFGAVSVTYRIPLGGALDRLLTLGESLWDNQALLAASRRFVDGLVEVIRPAVVRPVVSSMLEDYVVYQLSRAPSAEHLSLPDETHQPLAQLLRVESEPLSQQEVTDALACQIRYGQRDCTLVDWNAAIIFDGDDDSDDVRAVLEFANVQLLESRLLDDQLDRDLDHAYAALPRRDWRDLLPRRQAATMQKLAAMQIDAAMLNEGVNNALKLVGDQHLARVYRLAAERLHLPEWHANVQRKLDILGRILERVSERHSTTRLELLEWIIIVLIAVSIMLPFVSDK